MKLILEGPFFGPSYPGKKTVCSEGTEKHFAFPQHLEIQVIRSFSWGCLGNPRWTDLVFSLFFKKKRGRGS